MEKRIYKNIIFILVTVLLTVVLLTVAGNILAPTDNDTALARDQVQYFHSLPKNSIDVFSFGSSYNWRGMDAKYLSDRYGISAYNYGCNWQHINTTWQFFYDALKTQSPQMVLIETKNVDDMLIAQAMDGEIYYSRPVADFSIHTLKYLHQCFGSLKNAINYATFFFPVLEFHGTWESVTEKNFIREKSDYDFSTSNGSLMLEEANPMDREFRTGPFEQKRIPSQALEILEDIASECSERGIRLVFYTVPNYAGFHYSDELTEFAQSHGCQYINLYYHQQEMNLDGNTDFNDPAHLNASGARKVSECLYQLAIKECFQSSAGES